MTHATLTPDAPTTPAPAAPPAVRLKGWHYQRDYSGTAGGDELQFIFGPPRSGNTSTTFIAQPAIAQLTEQMRDHPLLERFRELFAEQRKLTRRIAGLNATVQEQTGRHQRLVIEGRAASLTSDLKKCDELLARTQTELAEAEADLKLLAPIVAAAKGEAKHLLDAAEKIIVVEIRSQIRDRIEQLVATLAGKIDAEALELARLAAALTPGGEGFAAQSVLTSLEREAKP